MNKSKYSIFTTIGVSMFLVFLILASLVSVILQSSVLRIGIEWTGLLLIILISHQRISLYESDYPIFAFLLLMIVNCFRGNPTFIFDFSIMLPFLLLCIFIRKNDSILEYFYKVMTITFIVYALATIFFYFNGSLYYIFVNKFFPNESLNLVSLYQNNCMAGLTSHYTLNGIINAIGLLMIYCKLLDNGYKNNNKNKYLLLFVLFTIALLLTGKRGPLIFTVVAMFVVYFYHLSKDSKGRIIKILFFIIVLFLFAVILYYFLPPLATFINRFISTSQSGDVTLGRTKYWELAWNIFKSNPFFGIGWGNFKFVAESKYGKVADAHNTYLQLLAETGLVGIIIYIILILSSLIKTIKLYKYNIINNSQTNSKKYLLAFSLGFQTFFIIYAFTGNPLYTPVVYMTYFISYTITEYFNYQYYKNKGEVN